MNKKKLQVNMLTMFIIIILSLYNKNFKKDTVVLNTELEKKWNLVNLNI
jgi:hypothetical protein